MNDTRYRDDPEYREKKLAYWRERASKMSPEERRAQHLKKKYGMTPAAYDELYEAQGGQCAICKESREVLDVDHDHETGTVRGLLCRGCNTAIGKLGDSVSGLARALRYLEGAV